MPPKKTTTKAGDKNSKSGGQNGTKPDKEHDTVKKEDPKEEEEADTTKLTQDDAEETTKPGDKRKTHPTISAKDKPPKKEPRAGNRNSTRQPGGGTANAATPAQVLTFLLTADSLPYCFPSNELEAARSGDFPKTYSHTAPNHFTPFEHLITAHLLSKPLSHTLGMRSTRTLLNEPYGFATPGTLHAAGEEKIWKALEEAKTQHRQKTAAYLAQMGEEFAGSGGKDDNGGKGDGEKMRELAEKTNDGGPRETIEYIKKTVKGMGETGAQIFCRRVQACGGWGGALWPYADPRSIDALRELGVKVADAEGLQEMIRQDVDLAWVKKNGGLGFDEKKGDGDASEEVVLVTVLERAIGCALEGKIGELRSAAAAAGK